ncbi:MAG: DNA-directed DNA polymerase II small subunit [Candidatus Methanoplasma sp.]|nr:DNA-directed DNA polymerase II small subunit [Candidatus Methanoplasma sp.]
MKEEVLGAVARRNVFLSPDALEMVMSNSDPLSFVNTVLSALSKSAMFVSKKDIMDCIAGDKVLFESANERVRKNKLVSDLAVASGTDVTGCSTCEGKINDFVVYFKNRFSMLSKILRENRDFMKSEPAGDVCSIKRAFDRGGRDAKIIGMVYERSETRNGHKRIVVEDEEGKCTVLITKDSPMASETFTDDEVIGVCGKPSTKGDLFIANKIFRPDVPSGRRWVPSDSSASVAILSDAHVGSHTFLKSQWNAMISWLKANAYESEIDYLILPGDVVDGIGIYPGHDKDLDVKDIYRQYEMLSEYLKEIPDHMKIVVQPGNHDAVRPAEPQPALGGDFAKCFDSEVILTSNPVSLKIEGRNILTYHGKSIDDWVAKVSGMSYDDPARAMKEMLVRRHLSPIYGAKNPLAPEKKDYLVIETAPDVFISGHVHGAAHLDYRGVKVINASAWQGQTEYQRSHNFSPEPAVMPVVNLGSGRVDMKRFD